MTACPDSRACFFAASPHHVFRYFQGSWQKVFALSSTAEKILRIRVFKPHSFVWIQTQKSLYRLDPATGAAPLIYQAGDPAKMPLSFCAGEKFLWLGTLTGLWVSKDAGKTWQKRSDLADHQAVDQIAETQIGLFFSAGGEWRLAEEGVAQTVLRLFDFTDQSDSADTSETADSGPADAKNFFFDFIETEEAFYLATLKGIFESKNGFDWHALPLSGLKDVVFSRIAWNKKAKQLSGITSAGFFMFSESSQKWQSQNEGLAKTELSAFLFLSEEEPGLFIASSEGLWRWKSPAPAFSMGTPRHAELFSRLVRLEPSARDIHKRVIRYSDTGNGKIKRWQIQSRLASLLPNLSLGKDWGISNNIDLDRAGTSDPDRFISGPWDKNRGADVDLSWDLGDFIFSSNQTSIDSRAKLMVDLRNDLLSEATRLFYERRRLQAEIVQDPSPDEKTHLDRLLRLEELTSLLDALTDGYLSEKLERIYKQNPELEELWKCNQPKA